MENIFTAVWMLGYGLLDVVEIIHLGWSCAICCCDPSLLALCSLLAGRGAGRALVAGLGSRAYACRLKDCGQKLGGREGGVV